jgi:ribosomal protein S18 acetylase RimI-like enzyme
VTSAFRIAAPDDAPLVLALMREFVATQSYPFEEERARRAVSELLARPEHGAVWLIEEAGAPVGYVALALGFSLEYGGRDAFVDELYVRAAHRGRGLGRAALSFALAEAERRGVCAVHLEVERSNPSAQRLYRSLGFAGHDRELLTRRLRR